MSGPRGDRDLCKNKNPWQSPFKLIKKNKYANEKKSKLKKKANLKNDNNERRFGVVMTHFQVQKWKE